jgi:hypothetical protein
VVEIIRHPKRRKEREKHENRCISITDPNKKKKK